jgi:hypothetical protein
MQELEKGDKEFGIQDAESTTSGGQGVILVLRNFNEK